MTLMITLKIIFALIPHCSHTEKYLTRYHSEITVKHTEKMSVFLCFSFPLFVGFSEILLIFSVIILKCLITVLIGKKVLMAFILIHFV